MTQDKLDALKAEIIAKNICPELAATATQLVMGDGNLMLTLCLLARHLARMRMNKGFRLWGQQGSS